MKNFEMLVCMIIFSSFQVYFSSLIKWNRKKSEKIAFIELADFKKVLRRFRKEINEMNMSAYEKAFSPIPSYEKPFFFLHARKSGGSLIRYQLKNAGIRLKKETYIACYNMSCEVYAPPQQRNFSAEIVAGHFPIDSTQRVQYFRENNGTSMHIKNLNELNCMLSYRNPIERVQSCWNYRFMGRKLKRIKKFSDNSARNISDLLPISIDEFGNGCNNEIVRIMSRKRDSEMKMNAMTLERGDGVVMLEILTQILDAMKNCVVVIQEKCEESERNVRNLLPWFTEYNCSRKLNEGNIAPTKLKESIRREVIRQNLVDWFAYKGAILLLKRQLALKKTDKNTLTY